MKKIFKPVLAAGLVLTASAPMFSAPVAAQQIAQGVGVVSLPAVVANSNAFKVAEQQRPVTYKAQMDQANARRDQLTAQLGPLYDKFRTDQQANVAQTALQQQAAQIQQIEQAGQRELNQIIQPLAMSRAYVQEQIEDLLDDAVQAAAKKKNVSLILDPSSGVVVYADAKYNITQDVVNELNRLLPSAQLVPPQGWLPREARQQQEAAAAQGAAQGAAPAAAPQPQGR
ncbi:OmpH family outer membrane protein [Altererythrobacter confluentis]|uniref:OmpH family outer membrane protein n=1 Tax=Allopontixanthobacter confluentis TaxID=1849021 RepID=A0A6L7GFT1_9SPHN|nr:OmpH family outer membrane protein [Allopontixanthobacter confluentis]MXP13818.1 OmpH family outer membrane protein [Allopontixanthobacter confluentis]